MTELRRPLSIVSAALPGALFGLYQAFRPHPGVEPIRLIDAVALFGSGLFFGVILMAFASWIRERRQPTTSVGKNPGP